MADLNLEMRFLKVLNQSTKFLDRLRKLYRGKLRVRNGINGSRLG